LLEIGMKNGNPLPCSVRVSMHHGERRQDGNMNERVDTTDLYNEVFLRGAEDGMSLAERVARQVYLRCLAEDRRPYHRIVGEEPTGATGRSAHFFRKRLLDYLIDKGDLVAQEDGTLAMSAELARTPIADEDTKKLSCDGYVLLAQLPEVAESILAGVDGFQAIGQKHGMGTALDRWVSAMVEMPVRLPGVILAARALTQRLQRGPCVVFEGGAGVGAVLRHALAIPAFGQALPNLERYYFTDISPILLSIGKHWLRSNAPPGLMPRMRFETHDLDRTPLQELPYTRSESVDVIILEMVLYDVANLHDLLLTLRNMLRPGGLLVFTMAFRQRPALFFPAEMLQSTLHSYYRAKLDPPRRINCGYLTLEEWQRSLADAGFTEYHVHPDPDRHPALLFGGIVAFK
jgi:SAM-dependent methyltransferase